MIGPPAVMFVAMPAIVPNTRGMYELAAMQELRKAIELAPELDLQTPLAPDVWAAEDVKYLPLVTPTVGDLLAALGADRYPARAHNVLGMMYTERGLFEEAEEHLDAAAAQRMNGPTAYRELGAALEAEERYDDAVRVYLKAFRNGDVNLIPAIKVFINGWKAA
jgi:tetratricopeptide (TPR) repeat protein